MQKKKLLETRNMDGSLGHFKATLQRKKQRAEKKGNRAEHYSSKPGQKVEYNFPKLSKDELEKLKEKIRLDSKRRKKKCKCGKK